METCGHGYLKMTCPTCSGRSQRQSVSIAAPQASFDRAPASTEEAAGLIGAVATVAIDEIVDRIEATGRRYQSGERQYHPPKTSQS